MYVWGIGMQTYQFYFNGILDHHPIAASVSSVSTQIIHLKVAKPASNNIHYYQIYRHTAPST